MNGGGEAVLSLVGQISFDDFWLLPLGGWTPGNLFNEPITKARANCHLIRPNNDGQLAKLHSDSPRYLENLEALQKLGWGSKVKDGMQKVSCIVNGGITLTHYLFDVSTECFSLDLN
jgi:hypothetical protein